MIWIFICVLLIDGSVYVECEVLIFDVVCDQIIVMKMVQIVWVVCFLVEWIELVMQGVVNVGVMNDDIVLELVYMMGWFVCYGGEFGGFNECVSYMVQIVEILLVLIEVGEDVIFKWYIKCVFYGVVLVVVLWNYFYMIVINIVVFVLIVGNVVVLKYVS